MPTIEVKSAWDHFNYTNRTDTSVEALCKWCTFKALLPSQPLQPACNPSKVTYFCKTAQSHLQEHHPDMILEAISNPAILNIGASATSITKTKTMNLNSPSVSHAQSPSVDMILQSARDMTFVDAIVKNQIIQGQKPSASTTPKSFPLSGIPKPIKKPTTGSESRSYETRKASLPSYKEDEPAADESESSSGSDSSSKKSRRASSTKKVRVNPSKQTNNELKRSNVDHGTQPRSCNLNLPRSQPSATIMKPPPLSNKPLIQLLKQRLRERNLTVLGCFEFVHNKRSGHTQYFCHGCGRLLLVPTKPGMQTHLLVYHSALLKPVGPTDNVGFKTYG